MEHIYHSQFLTLRAHLFPAHKDMSFLPNSYLYGEVKMKVEKKIKNPGTGMGGSWHVFPQDKRVEKCLPEEHLYNHFKKSQILS